MSTKSNTNRRKIDVPLLGHLFAEGKKPEYLFWVGSAGSYDDRAKKITRDFIRILEHANVDYAVLGTEEIDTGDVARRAGNEFLFQMQALQLIEIFTNYEVKKIITCDPHDYNTFKNEYPELGGIYQVYHHTQFIQTLIKDGKLKIRDLIFSGKSLTFHDPCYLGRGNNEYEAPRFILTKTNATIIEMTRNRSSSLCCGAGGAQMFKEAEAGNKEVYVLRTEDALKVAPNFIVTACPFCMVMLTDGLKMLNKTDIKVLDIAEVVSKAIQLEP